MNSSGKAPGLISNLLQQKRRYHMVRRSKNLEEESGVAGLFSPWYLCGAYRGSFQNPVVQPFSLAV